MTATTVRLYELVEMRDVLDAWLEESAGELTPELEQLLNELAGQTNEKIERVGLFIRELTATAKAIKEESDRLRDRAAVKEKAVEGLKRYLLGQMQRAEIKKVDGLLCTVAVQINGQPSVTTPLKPDELYAVDDARPFVNKETKVVYALDREAILAAWKNGQALPACITVERGYHVRVR